ncbi:bifunctional fucokinase/L-fucose-1-P-guanylyltransferase [Puniceicoccales bacterium CK1056]|uniref:Bifunctional fucokinase/L-fucose-1-P-guanylyltransferase n=1 Tax=Oceanipulchritudo coccoides TaxID=2706888 RepID=A0A6B2M1Y3_9BACT|nr:bifunctional fucokinase/fucose-1-phosphate guanylyltransferase [Oceanipulchritudo coccoides]NDV61740.1 bifunctional fucokinase/L-fucose-1-P-guanylyltransferase [Oceanipulchritudo coccoides]
MQKLISLSPSVADQFTELTGKASPEWFCTHDPAGSKLGSGGGTIHLLREAWASAGRKGDFPEWIEREKGILLHAGGQSRRLPGYAAEGKALIPVPVFRWSTGQRINQTLLDLQVPFLEQVMETAGEDSRWLIASGDVMLHADRLPASLPSADVVCLGIWGEPEQATRHGVFFTPRNDPESLSFMLQKPTLDEIRNCARDHYFLLDVGVWLLSGRAMRVLLERCFTSSGGESGNSPVEAYDLYGDFGPALGMNPHRKDEEVNALSSAILPLEGGEFYHFGSGPDLIESTLRLQNRIIDQRQLSTTNIKPHPSMFVQNSFLGKGLLSEKQSQIWVENSHLGANWSLDSEHVITGIPENDWSLSVPAGLCLDCVPLKDGGRVVRVYGIRDPFRGPVGDEQTLYAGVSFNSWLISRGISLEELGLDPSTDLQEAAIFPVFKGEIDSTILQWLLTGEGDCANAYKDLRRISAETISRDADLPAIKEQRDAFLTSSLPLLAKHADRSVFYQVDLEHLAGLYAESEFSLPEARPDEERELFKFIRDAMFRACVLKRRNKNWENEEEAAFAALRTALIKSAKSDPVRPALDCLEDQIIWARSPVRLDLAGGWTDTPPYCFLNGGKVVNVAVELNGQPPIQVFVRPRREGGIKIRSIDLGISEELYTYDDLRSYADLGSGFAIAKAALALCGFLPEFHSGKCPDTLEEFLRNFGSGIEISLLCAVPKGSGLGTSSILSATLLGALSELCQLGWNHYIIGQRVLVLEQMLTSGGGWQDQFGGICRGLKYLDTAAGLDQSPKVHWLDDHLFTDPSAQPNILLYYTGITRVAKNVLGEIVRGMFLNSQHRLRVLEKIGKNALRLQASLQEGSYEDLAASVDRSWQLNQALDSGTNTPEIEGILKGLEPWMAGCKLLGAGGGGYLLMLAKDSSAAQKIKEHLSKNPPNPRARFVDVAISNEGLQVTRS